FFIHVMYLNLELFHFAFGTLNLVIITYLYWNGLRMCLIICDIVAIWSATSRLHMRTIKFSILWVIHATRSKTMHGQLTRKIHSAHAQYCDMLGKAAHINAKSVSHNWLISLLTNLGLNIWIVTLFVYWPLNSAQIGMFSVFLSLQSIL